MVHLWESLCEAERRANEAEAARDLATKRLAEVESLLIKVQARTPDEKRLWDTPSGERAKWKNRSRRAAQPHETPCHGRLARAGLFPDEAASERTSTCDPFSPSCPSSDAHTLGQLAEKMEEERTVHAKQLLAQQERAREAEECALADQQRVRIEKERAAALTKSLEVERAARKELETRIVADTREPERTGAELDVSSDRVRDLEEKIADLEKSLAETAQEAQQVRKTLINKEHASMLLRTELEAQVQKLTRRAQIAEQLLADQSSRFGIATSMFECQEIDDRDGDPCGKCIEEIQSPNIKAKVEEFSGEAEVADSLQGWTGRAEVKENTQRVELADGKLWEALELAATEAMERKQDQLRGVPHEATAAQYRVELATGTVLESSSAQPGTAEKALSECVVSGSDLTQLEKELRSPVCETQPAEFAEDQLSVLVAENHSLKEEVRLLKAGCETGVQESRRWAVVTDTHTSEAYASPDEVRQITAQFEVELLEMRGRAEAAERALVEQSAQLAAAVAASEDAVRRAGTAAHELDEARDAVDQVVLKYDETMDECRNECEQRISHVELKLEEALKRAQELEEISVRVKLDCEGKLEELARRLLESDETLRAQSAELSDATAALECWEVSATDALQRCSLAEEQLAERSAQLAVATAALECQGVVLADATRRAPAVESELQEILVAGTPLPLTRNELDVRKRLEVQLLDTLRRAEEAEDGYCQVSSQLVAVASSLEFQNVVLEDVNRVAAALQSQLHDANGVVVKLRREVDMRDAALEEMLREVAVNSAPLRRVAGEAAYRDAMQAYATKVMEQAEFRQQLIDRARKAERDEAGRRALEEKLDQTEKRARYAERRLESLEKQKSQMKIEEVKLRNQQKCLTQILAMETKARMTTETVLDSMGKQSPSKVGQLQEVNAARVSSVNSLDSDVCDTLSKSMMKDLVKHHASGHGQEMSFEEDRLAGSTAGQEELSDTFGHVFSQMRWLTSMT